MKSRLSRLLLVAGLALVAAPHVVAAQPVTRDHRRGPPDRAPVAEPTTAPPELRAERVGRRKGWVFVRGHWDWRGKWVWVPGRWEKRRLGKRWRERRWEQRGNIWVAVDGDWEDAPRDPIAAPPPPRSERIGRRRGHVWVAGRYVWEDGDWVWQPGRWERVRVGHRWVDGRWEDQGGRWVWVDGRWETGGGGPQGAFDPTGWTLLGSHSVDGRRDRDVIPVGRYSGRFDKITVVVHDSDLELEDFVIVFGNGERFTPRIRHAFREGTRSRAIDLPGDDRMIRHIEIQYRNLPGGGRARVEVYGKDTGRGRGGGAIMYPTTEPPPLRAETPGAARRGFIWVRGHWEWRNGQYEWIPGHWERERARHRWNDGRWERRGDRWEWNAGGWVELGAAPPPAPTPAPAPPPPVVSGPTQAPPPPRTETVTTRAGFIWVRGRWDWRNGQYEWIPGHWERQRAQQRWVDGRWERRGSVYIWVDGGWQ